MATIITSPYPKSLINSSINNYLDNSSGSFVYTTDSIVKANTLKPYVSMNPYRGNLVNFGYYNDLNEDKKVIKTITKYYYYKIIDKWFWDNLFPILGFVKISSDGKPYLIKNLKEYNLSTLNKDSEDAIQIKIDYLVNIFVTRNMVKHVLDKVVKKYKMKWYQLNKYSDLIKKVFYKYIKEKLVDSIEKSMIYNKTYKKSSEEVIIEEKIEDDSD